MQISAVRTNPFSLIRKQTLPKIVPHNLTKRRVRLSTFNSSDEEREAVEQLNDWEKRDTKPELSNAISEAKIALNKRIQGLDIVEEIKFRRKHKNKLPQLSVQALPLIRSMQTRQARKEAEESLRERCRYFRMYEEDLMNSRNTILKDITRLKQQRNHLREDLVELKKKISQANENIEFLRKELEDHEERSQNRKSQEELTTWMLKRAQLKESIHQADKEKSHLISSVKSECELLNTHLESLDTQIKELKTKSESLKSSLSKHYFSLLKEGQDTKSQGLQWIVISLWKLGESVTIDHFPSFLDTDAIHFILFLSQKTLESEEILNKLINPSRRSSQSFGKITNNVQNVKQRLQALTKNFQSDKPEYIYNSVSKKFTIHWVPLSQSQESSMISHQEPLGYYENYIHKLKELIEIATSNEIQRLTIECTLHNYEERFKTNIKELISVICGVENIDKHMAGIAKKKRYLAGVLEGNRSVSLSN
jgi:hypothetical protein